MIQRRRHREVWEIIADSWRNLRNKPEIIVSQLANEVEVESVLDIGCGSGRNILPFLERGIKCVGLDYAKSMIREAKKFLMGIGLKPLLVVGDAVDLPFKKKSFDLVLCIRTLHHVETRRLRIKTLREMKATGRKMLLSVWKKWQRRFIPKLVVGFFDSDVYVPWRYHGKTLMRFYHLYTKNELEADLRMAGIRKFKLFDDGKNFWVETL